MVAKKKPVKKCKKPCVKKSYKSDFVRDFVKTTLKDPKRKAIIDSFYIHAAYVKHSIPSDSVGLFLYVTSMDTINKIDREFRKAGVK